VARFTPAEYAQLLARRASVDRAAPQRPPHPIPQPDPRNESVDPGQAEAPRPGRCFISIVSRRKRLIDPRANLYGGTKYVEDALVYAGAIQGDTEAASEGIVTQEKVGKGEAEETIIRIWKL